MSMMLVKCSLLAFNVAALCLILGVKANPKESDDAPLTGIYENYPDNEKRSHNIMRFGKRMANDESEQKRNHKMIHFGKRDFSNAGEGRFPDELLRILRSEDRDWWKRGHNIMRFGKRGEDHHFIHFGKRSEDDLVSNDDDFVQKDPLVPHALIPYDKRFYFPGPFNSEELLESASMGNKRFPHAMIHFGKRENEDQEYPSNYFNDNGDLMDNDDDELLEKRAHAMIHFGKKDEPYESEDKRSHQLMHFGKRYSEEEEKRDHKLIRFGKRFEQDDDKRSHQLMHFGKRFEQDDKRSHQLMHFGKRFEQDDDKRSHQLMHFGKRFEQDDDKRSHQLMHFGKRLEDSGEKKSHVLMHFGKRLNDLDDKRSHALMHFGKRFSIDDKRAHAMIHFGKRLEGEVDKSSDYKLFYPKKFDSGDHKIIHFGKRNAEPIRDHESEEETSRTKRYSKNETSSDTSVNVPPFNRSQTKRDN